MIASLSQPGERSANYEIEVFRIAERQSRLVTHSEVLFSKGNFTAGQFPMLLTFPVKEANYYVLRVDQIRPDGRRDTVGSVDRFFPDPCK